MTLAIIVFILVVVVGMGALWTYANRERLPELSRRVRLAVDKLRGMTPEEVTAKEQELLAILDDAYNRACLFDEPDHFISHTEWIQYKNDYREQLDTILYLRRAKSPLASDQRAIKVEATVRMVISSVGESIRTQHNDDYQQRQLTTHAEFFDTLLAYPLDKQQRDAIVSLEDSTLVVSSAGSGKTSTIVGKTRYLVDRLGVSPDRILLISYTRKAAAELRDRLGYEAITCSTFHRLAMDLIAEREGRMPDICPPDRLQQVFYDLLKTSEYRVAMVNYMLIYKKALKDDHDYSSPAERYADRRRYGVQAPYPDMDGHIVYTKSEQEMQLCTMFSLLELRYRYEAPYPYETGDKAHRQYRPDFTIFYNDAAGKEHTFYWEHWAIDKSGNVPPFFGQEDADHYDDVAWRRSNREYREGMVWKRLLHQKHATRLVESSAAELYASDVQTVVMQKLRQAGVPVEAFNADAVYTDLVARDKYLEKNVLDLISSFINLLKANGRTLDELLSGPCSPRTRFVLTQLVRPVYDEYQYRLAKQHQLDFTDCIIRATDYSNETPIRSFDYILVDEFQDISIDRYRFLLSLRQANPDTRLFCVGDDWQSIYRFSGSDMMLFSDYERYFGFTKRCRIETTHRFGQPLVDRSSTFIQRNPVQVRKHVRPMGNAETQLFFCGYNAADTAAQYMMIRQLLTKFPADESVYIIGRYTFDVETLNLCDNVRYDAARGLITVLFDGRELQYMTIHSSKGLEADNVIMLNCNEGRFPSTIEDDPVLSYVLSTADKYQDSEERRVFYVGITRAKRRTYVFYDNARPSPFVNELNGSPIPPDRHICPTCKCGYLYVHKRGMSKIKHPYEVLRCSNNLTGCTYLKTVFIGDPLFGRCHEK